MEWPTPELKYLQAGGPQGLQALLEERIHNYQEAVASAKEASEAAKARRCERGLKVSWAHLETSSGAVGKAVGIAVPVEGWFPHQPYRGGGSLAWWTQVKMVTCVSGLVLFPQTLESQLAAVRKGRKINEEEIPPPVALGKRPLGLQETANRNPKADSPAPSAMDTGNWRHLS